MHAKARSPAARLLWATTALALATGLSVPLRAQEAGATPDAPAEAAQPATETPSGQSSLACAAAIPQGPVASTAAQAVPAVPSTQPEPSPDAQSGADAATAHDPAACPPLAPLRPPAPDLFGLAAAPVSAKALRTAWDAVRNAPFEEPQTPAFVELMEQLRQGSGIDPVDLVNRWVNWHVRFVEDQSDEWASASQTLARGYGDCEDLAVLKMTLLEKAGIPPDRMFLVLVRQLPRPVEHAVLALRRDEGMVVLDNRTDQLKWADQIADYYPTLSFSGDFAWIYGRPQAHLSHLRPVDTTVQRPDAPSLP